jgi:hypothetical protein
MVNTDYSIKIHFEGVFESLKQVNSKFSADLSKALLAQTDKLMLGAKALTPVDTGALKSSFSGLNVHQSAHLPPTVGFVMLDGKPLAGVKALTVNEKPKRDPLDGTPKRALCFEGL